VALVLVVVEVAARVAERVRLVVARGLEDEAGLEQRLAEVVVDLGEPLAELGVVARVLDEVVRGVPDDRGRGAIREAREELAQLAAGLVERAVITELVRAVLAVLGDGLGMARVLLDVADEPADGLLVVVVLLALNDDLEGNAMSTWRTRTTKNTKRLTFFIR
jgi:NTP pyrophosphatase (non-canonical NTP hydrolase)